MSAVGRALLPELCWSCASQPFSLPSTAWARQPRSSHLPAGNFWEQLMDVQEALPCGLKVLQGIISGQVQWSPSCLSWLFRIKGERDSAPGSLFFAGIDHPSPSLASVLCFGPFVCSEVAERWCPDQQSWSWQALGFWKARDVSRGVGLRKTKEILSYSTVDASRTSLWMLPALLSFCSLPNDFNSWTLLLFSFFIPTPGKIIWSRV